MPHPMKRDVCDDDGGGIVDTMLANPARAEDVKFMLRRSLNGSGESYLKPVPDAQMPHADDVEEMWDNVPV